MTIFTSIQDFALPFANTALIVGCAVCCFAMRRASQEQRKLCETAVNLAAAKETPPAFDDRELRRMVDRRMSLLEKRMILLVAENQKARRIPVGEPESDKTSLDHAVRMAQSGACVDDLVRDCGLSTGEAQLILRLHAASQSTANFIAH